MEVTLYDAIISSYSNSKSSKSKLTSTLMDIINMTRRKENYWMDTFSSKALSILIKLNPLIENMNFFKIIDLSTFDLIGNIFFYNIGFRIFSLLNILSII